MSFIDQIRKTSIPRKGGTLSALEKDGDPEALAAAFSNFKREKELVSIAIPRASSLYSACMRKHVIGTLFDLKEPRWISLRDKLIYGIGNAVHYWLQNSPDLFGDNRYGWWFCRGCRQTMYFGGPPKGKCRRCGASTDAAVYLEHQMTMKKPVKVSGHPDMFFKPGNSRMVRVAELKTLSGEEFDKLVSPIIDHEWQVRVYMWGCSKDSSIPVEVDPGLGYVVYVTKKQKKDVFPLKIFPIISNPDILRRIKDKLMLYKIGLEDYPKNLPPPLDECVRLRFEGYVSKSCVALGECRKYAK